MARQHLMKLLLVSASVIAAGLVLTAQSRDRFTLKSANGIAF